MLNSDIQYLKGVGPKKAKKFKKLGIFTIENLLNYYPIKYEDRRTVSKINEMVDNTKVLLKIKLFNTPEKKVIKKNMTIIKVAGRDDTGFVTLTFFNQDYLLQKLNLEDWFYVFGKVKYAYGKYELTNPDIEKVGKDKKAGRIMPIYGLTYGLSNNEITKAVKNALDEYYSKIEDIIPIEIKNKYQLISRRDAIKYFHFPENNKIYSLAKKSIAFEKLLIMQLGLLTIKNRLRTSSQGLKINDSSLGDKLIASIPYKLTNAQLKVIKEIKEDMRLSKPMNRLVQGDVGSGKTIVAIYAMLIAIKSGYQASMMAPTEILALQHYDTIKGYFKIANINLNVAFLSGSTNAKNKRKILDELKNGQIDIIVGTHALIENNVEFSNIGLVVTDEQHRFGVRQRAMLSNKGNNPDMIVMTATPIPRTLALIVYGDLDISVIDEMPPGRHEVITYVLNENQKNEAYSFIKKQIKSGRQGYIVAPLVEESENLEIDSAEKIFNELSNTYFSECKLGLLHGKMKSSDKEETINRFYNDEIKVLVSTTVIEVGVNVPNAVVMMVLSAERFGLAQLHQLRGRVGRGKYQSYCILVNGSKSKKSSDRMNIMKNTNNGFIIAEEDLKNRGPGEFFGTKQHGLSKYEVQNIINDVNIVQKVQLLSKKIINENPFLDKEEYINLKEEIIKLFKNEDVVFN
ncbi:ATP-dependent DNA helicase RecG [Sedimentibacter sp. MB31-C6]|uniref:ATP-dependent DNA helicase RecG n=1 Tax=Sedimentibacter sp. MB31-C6 TaxID=3109366 RepID=UPI002DDCEE78|nr:ATP-dependent DNA helicase RecG [Sedimentibacter sp. MB36-C1]WSI04314.1 ATP-dependent DNA helicase RecG [Sedimentibacter sp. MB36-C1]